MNYKLTYEKLIKTRICRLAVLTFMSSVFAATLTPTHASSHPARTGTLSHRFKNESVHIVTTRRSVMAEPVALDKANRGGVVQFPGRGFKTLQEAIDAVPDGGTPELAAGVHPVNEGLFVRNKSIFFEGPGRRKGITATLVAPRPDRVVPAASALGVINFINGGGGLRGCWTFAGVTE